MPPPDKLPEGTTAAPAAPTAPTEGGVSAETVAQGQKLETSQKLGALGQEIEQAQADAQAEATAAPSGTPPGAPPPAPAATTQEKPKTGWAGFVSSLSAGFSKISEWLGDAGKKIGEWISDLMGIKKKDPKAKPEVADTAVPFSTPERIVEDSEMLTPNAPVFSFGKNFIGTPHVSDVPAVRPVHPVTGELNVPHEGVDIPAPVGAPLYATKPITIDSMATGTLKGHLDDGTKVVFRHVSKIAPFKVGDRAPKGTWLADTGNVGVSSGPHLHFEVNDGESDPIPYLDAGLVASAEKKIQEKKDNGEWIPLESDEHKHGLA